MRPLETAYTALNDIDAVSNILEAMKGWAISGAIFGCIHLIPGMGVPLGGGGFSEPLTQAMVHAGGGALSGAIRAGVAKYVGGKFFSGAKHFKRGC
ncbi:hypothetical protein EPICR_10226 [Candidatus Desulfarcum epimagneticum]|uniref:Uncharacterized protein n=1 Tax=uncultured Desulfobacteraceae bacterium TaxID=218296 RepID=A0A484HIQ9_9BACT|nr:hypothetical protein EPICR_10226 [uncultured Desulfobacteraceae bacterium]